MCRLRFKTNNAEGLAERDRRNDERCLGLKSVRIWDHSVILVARFKFVLALHVAFARLFVTVAAAAGTATVAGCACGNMASVFSPRYTVGAGEEG